MVTTSDLIPPLADDTAPEFSGVAVTNLANGSVVVSWFTSEPADSLVEYGTSLEYGTSFTNSVFGVSHLATLTNLMTQTTNHFRLKSRDPAGNEAVSGDFFFYQPATRGRRTHHR